jgi:hypothetical protein
MAVGYNPTVVTSGLQLYYDMNNTSKSWKGQPATNLVTYPYADWTGSAFSLSYNYDQSGGATQTYTTNISNPVNAPGIFRYYTGTTGYKYWAFRTTVPSAGTYTFSYYARISGGSANTINMQQLWRDTDATDRTPTGNWNPTFTSNWARYTLTSTVTTYLDMFICHSGSMTGGIQLDLCGFQLESGTYATPFVAGSRSTTTALIDMASNNTLTATSLTYASSNTFSFNGSNNTVSVASTASLQFLNRAPYTLDAWVYPTANPGTNNWTGIINREYDVGAGRDGYNMYLNGSAGTAVYWVTERFTSGTNINVTGTYTQSEVVNNWQHMVATYDGTTLRLYRNGVFITSTAATGNITNATTSVQIGRRDVNYFNGQIPVAKIYNTALTATQVAQNFQALRGRYGV